MRNNTNKGILGREILLYPLCRQLSPFRKKAGPQRHLRLHPQAELSAPAIPGGPHHGLAETEQFRCGKRSGHCIPSPYQGSEVAGHRNGERGLPREMQFHVHGRTCPGIVRSGMAAEKSLRGLPGCIPIPRTVHCRVRCLQIIILTKHTK